MKKKFESESSRSKREHWGRHYFSVTRDENDRIIESKKWHPPMVFGDKGSYQYVVRAKNEDGDTRTLTIRSEKRYSMDSKFQRDELKNKLKIKYSDMDPLDYSPHTRVKRHRRYNFSIDKMRWRFVTDIVSGERWH